jgi:hypothetical protein
LHVDPFIADYKCGRAVNASEATFDTLKMTCQQALTPSPSIERRGGPSLAIKIFSAMPRSN